jgi:hypothetical protein
MRACSCGNKTFKCSLIIKSDVVVTDKYGTPTHDINAVNNQSSDYNGPYECTVCGKHYNSLCKPICIPGLHKKRCACGSTKFFASQQCYHDVIADSNNIFQADIGCSEAEQPYGPYTCIECGMKYDELDDLEDIQGEV